MSVLQYTYDESRPPRNPAEYRPDKHAIIKKWARNVDGWLIEYLIKEGEIKKKGKTRFVFQKELESPDPDSLENRTDLWVMPVELTYNQPNEEFHIVTTSPYILGIEKDSVMAEINPYKPTGY